METLSSPITEQMPFTVCNLYVVHAKDAVRDEESGFCLFDPDDTQNGYDTMRVAVEVADYYVANYTDTTRITANWHDPETGQTLHSEYEDVVIASDGTASSELEWDGSTGSGTVAKGPYPYTVLVGQPAGVMPVITYDWQSPWVTVSDVEALWLGNGNSVSSNARAYWETADSAGGQELSSTEVLAIRGDFAILSFGDVPNALGEQSVEDALARASSNDDDTPWWFLVRVKDKHPERSRAHQCRYARVVGVPHPKLIADNFNDEGATLQDELDDEAAFQQRRASYVATAHGAQSVSYAMGRWDNYSNIWFAAAHGNAGVIELTDNDFLTGNNLETHDGDLRLAVFVSCYSAETSQIYGNLCNAALDAGADCALGFTDKLKISNLANDPGKQWCRQFWTYLAENSYAMPDWGAIVVEAALRANGFQARLRRDPADYGLFYNSNFWTWDVFGDSSTKLWPY